MKNIFLFKCNLPTLRLTPLITLLVLPFALTRLLCWHQRVRPPSSSFVPTLDAVVLSAFPIVWFFGFLYYTEVPSLLFVVSTIVASSQNKHWLAALVRPRFLLLTLVWRWRCMCEGTLTDARMLARSCKLHVQTDEHNMGSVCLCVESVDVSQV